MGTRARRADRLSRSVLARGASLSVATPRKHRRGTGNRADARRLPVPERNATLSRLAGGRPNTWLRACHRQSRFAFGRDRARQPRGRLLWRDLLSALFVALAAVCVCPHLARGAPDHAGSVRAGGCRGAACGAHLPADRAAGSSSVSSPAIRDCVGPRRLACVNRSRGTDDLRLEGLSVPVSAAGGPHLRL